MTQELLIAIFIASKTVAFMFGLIYTFVAIRATGAYIAAMIAERSISMSAGIYITPAIAWGIFYCLNATQNLAIG